MDLINEDEIKIEYYECLASDPLTDTPETISTESDIVLAKETEAFSNTPNILQVCVN